MPIGYTSAIILGLGALGACLWHVSKIGVLME
jgi:hypothetical protein